MSGAVEEYVIGNLVPRPCGMDGHRVWRFLKMYRVRSDSESACLNGACPGGRCCECETPPRLIMGCGTMRSEGWIGIDIQDDGADVLWDLEFPLPWPVNSVAAIVAQDVLEHLYGWRRILVGWLDMLRVGGEMSIRVPDMLSGNALRDPTHVALFSESSLDWLWADDIYRARWFRDGLKVEVVNRRPVVRGEQTWNLVKLAHGEKSGIE